MNSIIYYRSPSFLIWLLLFTIITMARIKGRRFSFCRCQVIINIIIIHFFFIRKIK
ncbi:hypothetical protein BDC45DRAFT_518425 [Circinella umbellata]|nr:hypothetical protein BDC45DRAFT_518425 [Circinella umbellata]